MPFAAAYGFIKRNCCGMRPRSGTLNSGCRAGSWMSAAVTAVTNAPEHAPVVEGFARECGVDGRVRTLVSDAKRLPLDGGPYDAAVAIESSGYFDRPLWFERLARVLRPGASVCIEEVFITRPHGADVWAEYFYTKPASVLDYVKAAQAAGFELVDDVDATS